MIDDAFLGFLEFELCKMFRQHRDDTVRQFWCDGVAKAGGDESYSSKFINDHREIVLTAWTGKTGQEQYIFNLCFGRKAQSRNARGLDLRATVPNAGVFGWDISSYLDVEIAKRTLRLTLL
jgi:hypothetical protein